MEWEKKLANSGCQVWQRELQQSVPSLSRISRPRIFLWSDVPRFLLLNIVVYPREQVAHVFLMSTQGLGWNISEDVLKMMFGLSEGSFGEIEYSKTILSLSLVII